ncbi:hypothetical protein ADUPG1_013283, partial [Aduncisulcus paluster]
MNHESFLWHGMGEEFAVLLGEEAKQKDLSIYDTFAGGSPIFLKGQEPSSSQLTCPICKKQMKLLFQAFAPLFSSTSETPIRTLHVFGCNSNHFAKSVRCFRNLSGKRLLSDKTVPVKSQTTDKPIIYESESKEIFDVFSSESTPLNLFEDSSLAGPSSSEPSLSLGSILDAVTKESVSPAKDAPPLSKSAKKRLKKKQRQERQKLEEEKRRKEAEAAEAAEDTPETIVIPLDNPFKCFFCDIVPVSELPKPKAHVSKVGSKAGKGKKKGSLPKGSLSDAEFDSDAFTS